jgi:hypothetical protein
MKHLKDFSIFEGQAFKDTKKKHAKKAWDPDKRADFREKIEDHVKSQGMKTKKVGNDLEILHDAEMIAQIMFREDYVGVKKSGVKFTDEFEYTELGKIKSKVSEIIKASKK